MRNKVMLTMESRIHGDMYVRFGGGLTETYHCKVAKRCWPSLLKEIADLCGITKKLTFHIARHTFATTVTLSNDVPIETVSKMLGHTNIKTTQHYAKLLDTKVSNDMGRLQRKMEVAGQIGDCTAGNNRSLLGVQICLPSLKTENTATVEAYG